MPRCVYCSSPLPAQARFCPSCGQPAGAPAPLDSAETLVTSPLPVQRIATPTPQAPGFAPGQILAGRYRIVGLLGRGGMGEVYRADDLKLGSAVALKFLPRAAGQDPSLIERFHAEVRSARLVSHPHVCRVYDIGEVEGRHFISMEYVDGEDLATLLHRIGRLPSAKAVEIARQLAAGLAAAHERGILHRDLKPANVMIDGHGRARINDFGLAVLGAESVAELAGTPAYMAPEQLAGQPATVQSDIYALGLVLYEVFTGHKAFTAASLAEWQRVHSESQPSSPSLHAAEIDPAVERLILRCLEKDPAQRPQSAAKVALALPGGDPLAAALAAGETPSPAMVAAAGGEGGLSPARAWTVLATFLLLIAALMLIAPASTDLGLAPMETSPDALRDRARGFVRDFGYADRPGDEVTWLQRDYPPLRWLADHDVSTAWRRRLPELGSPVLLTYRRSGRPLLAGGEGGRITATDPPPDPGDISVVLDARGRLREFSAEPPRWAPPAAPAKAFPAAAVFAATGLDSTRFTPVSPEWVPSTAFDERREWVGTRAEAPDLTLRLSATSFAGRLASVSIIGPWAAREAEDPLAASLSASISRPISAIVLLLLWLAAAYFARRNIRLGRGDRRGAFRVSVAAVVLSLLTWLVSAHLVWAGGGLIFAQLFPALGRAVFDGVFLWLAYMALEPQLRRRMPDLLVGWARVLDGRFRDPRVGRDVLIGLVLGAFLAVVYHLVNGLPTWIPFKSQTTIPLFGVEGGQRMAPLAAPFAAAAAAIQRTLGLLMMLFLLRLLTSRPWVSVLGLTVIFGAFGLGGENPALELPGTLITSLVIALTLVRLGPLAAGAMWFTSIFLMSSPLRASFATWYAPYALATLALVLVLALWSFRTALGGRAALGGLSLDA